MAFTKTQFAEAARNALAAYPNVAQYVKAGDPRVLAQLDAQATMLAMLSAQVDATKFEPFVKARDGTVLADAALKGILPLGRAARVTLAIQNTDAQPVVLAAQRRFLDPKGRIYELDAGATIPAGATRNLGATQMRRRTLPTKIAVARDFYSLPVSLSSDELFLNTLVVYKGTQEFTYAPDWFNVDPGQFAYQVEVDELRQMTVRFGKATVVGYGVVQGDEFTLEITECNGRIVDLAPGADFNLEYILTASDAALKTKLLSMQDEGAAPHGMPELRVMARYPAIYDHNAVYLGEFEFLLRRYMSGVRFLSVWNEQIEESVRGASVSNINKLFISGLVTGMTDAAFQARAVTLLKRADNSYRYAFVAPVLTPVPVTITASIAISWDRATVESQIRALLLANYGDGAVNVSQGMGQPIKKAQMNKMLREKIDALRDEKAEFDIAITLPARPLPEHFLHIASASLTISVSSVEYSGTLWNT